MYKSIFCTISYGIAGSLFWSIIQDCTITDFLYSEKKYSVINWGFIFGAMIGFSRSYRKLN